MAQALFQGNPEAWDRWNRSHAAMLYEQQAPDGSFSGSYGEAYGTAMSLLSLALNYRFPPDLRTLLNPCRAVSATLPARVPTFLGLGLALGLLGASSRAQEARWRCAGETEMS